MGLVKDKFKELNFPYQVNDKGWCEMLDENNKCKVYENRPDICSIEKSFYNIFKKTGMTMKETYLMNARLCNDMITQDKLDPKYLVDEKLYS